MNLTKDEYISSKTNLISQYQGSPVITGIIQAILAEIYELKQAVDELPKGRSLAFAQGRILDLCGSVVNLPRFDPGTPDDVYRNLIFAEIFANKSRGLKSDFQNIISLIINKVTSVRVINYGYGSFKIEISYRLDVDEAIPLSTQKILKRIFSKSSSANSELVSFLVVRRETFVFNSTTFESGKFAEVINLQRETQRFAITNVRTFTSSASTLYVMFQYGNYLRYFFGKDSANAWIIEDSIEFVRIRNYETGDYIHIEYEDSPVSVGKIDLQWLSSRWVLEKVGDAVMIRSVWKPNLYIGFNPLLVNRYPIFAAPLSSLPNQTFFQWILK